MENALKVACEVPINIVIVCFDAIKLHEDLVGNELKGYPEFYLGDSVTPEYALIEIQLIKMQKKINVDAKFFQTQAIYDIDNMREFRKLTRHMNCKVLAGIVPLKSAGMAKFMTVNEVDIDNFIKAKGAIYSGVSVLIESLGMDFNVIDKGIYSWWN